MNFDSYFTDLSFPTMAVMCGRRQCGYGPNCGACEWLLGGHVRLICQHPSLISVITERAVLKAEQDPMTLTQTHSHNTVTWVV